jgi:serine/threonine protein kinase
VAPEIFDKSSNIRYNYTCDLFSLGGILYYMMSKRETMLYAISMKKDIQSITKEFENIYSKKLIKILHNLLHCDPYKRISISEILEIFQVGEKINQTPLISPKKMNLKIETFPTKNIKELFSVTSPSPISTQSNFNPFEMNNFEILSFDSSEDDRNDKSLVLNSVKVLAQTLHFASLELKNDLEIVMAAVSQDGMCLKWASGNLRKTFDVVHAAVSQNGRSLEFAPSYQNNMTICIKAVRNTRWALKFVSPEMKNNQEIVKIAIRQNGRSLKYASNEIKNDKKFILEAIAIDAWVFEQVSMELKNDFDVVRAAVSKHGILLQHASEKMKGNQEIASIAVTENTKSLSHVSKDLKMDDLFILSLIKTIPNIIQHKELLHFKNDRKFILNLICQFPNCFFYIPIEFQRDEKLVEIAVKNDGFCLSYISNEFQNNEKIVLEAVKQNFKSMQFASQKLKDDEKFCKKIVSINGKCLQYLSERLKNNVQIVSMAVESDPNSWTFSSKEIQYMGTSSKYKTIKKISEGGEGVIYKVQNENDYYAEKRIFIQDINQLNLILKQFQLVQELKHENVYHIKEIFHDLNQVTGVCIMKLIMTLYKGDLMQLINKKYQKGVPESILIDFAIQITKGLLYLHENQIFHRDLKPENIFYQLEGDRVSLKIGDFGYSKISEFSSSFLGSLMYIAPEVILNESNHSFASDCWSLGVILYQMMFNDDRILYIDCLKNGRVSIENENYSPKLTNLVMNLMSLDPLKRLNSKEILDYLISMESLSF